MSLKIIQGGNINLEMQSEQLKMFVSHMRSLESNIASIAAMASKMEWKELNLKLIACHDQILDTLSYVKNSSKSKLLDNKKNKNFLKIVK